jgi:hypothetical protein
MSKTIKNAAGKEASVNTFHEHGRTHGACEVRAVVLLPLLTFSGEVNEQNQYVITVCDREEKPVLTFVGKDSNDAHHKMNAADLVWSKRVDFHLFDADELDLSLKDLVAIAEQHVDDKGNHRDSQKIEISSHNIADFKKKK